MTTFERIKKLAEKRNKNLQQVASDLGYGVNYFYSLNAGKNPSADKLTELASYFHVSVDYLLGRTENPTLNDAETPKEIDINDDTIIMTYGGKQLTEADRQVVLAATKALIEQRAKKGKE
jgi:transcriptional regulator with XRE-family HTH domain